MTSRTTTIMPGETATARPWWQLGLAAGIAAAVINVILFVLYQLVAGQPLRVVPPGAALQDLPVVMVIVMSIIPPLVATLLALALARWVANPGLWFTLISVVILLLSFLSPLTQPAEITTGTKLILSVMHLVVAGSTLAALLPRLSASRA